MKQFNGKILIAENNKIIYEKSLGFSNFDKKNKLNNNSQLPIASITKPFTLSAILQLKQQGKLKLDDLVKTFLPDFSVSGNFNPTLIKQYFRIGAILQSI